MIQLNWSDVASVLSSCRTYLITGGVLLVILLAVVFAVKSRKLPLRKLVRANMGIAAILVIAVIANMICFGPMSTLLTLATNGSGTISNEATEQALADGKQISEEGIVLLQNKDSALPMKAGNINVFGWAAYDPIYGGSGAGAMNDLYDRVTLLEGLADSGFTVNNDIISLYEKAGLQRPESYGQDWSLPELPATGYSNELIGSAKEFSDTAVIVIARNGGEGADLPMDMTQVPYTNNSADYNDFEAGESYLELSRTERDLVALVCGEFAHVVLVYDGLSTFELGFVEDYPQIEGVIWCAGTGQSGFDALGEVLCGTVNPSGKTADTFVYDLSKTPTINNFGSFAYDNMGEFAVDESDPYMGGAVPTFVNYVEGIYAGYRFYETASTEGLIDYDTTVQYPFGYGLSYTTFEQNLSDMAVENGSVKLEVTVTNTGSVAGKDVVEIYSHPPYTNGGIEKASANLVEYAKTELLDPGASQTISFTIEAEELASYDEKGKGCYVLEAGDYVLSINSDSHNVIDDYTWTVEDEVVYDESHKRSSDQIPAVNRFEDVAGNVVYLSRKDGFKNYDAATAAPASYTMPEEQKAAFVNTSNYVAQIDEKEQMPTIGASGTMQLKELRGADFDDPKWEELLDQLSIEEMNDMIAHSGFQTAAAPSVGKVSTVDSDGPSALSNNFTGAGSVGFPTAVMIACTWNDDLAYAYGKDMGVMAKELGSAGWYAPSANLHRSAFAGRTYEYFSEEPLICGNMAAQAVIGAEESGVYAYMKHFLMNEQETNRWAMLCTWSNEQAMREIYLKPFEICVKEGKAKAVMSSFNYLGGTWAGGDKALLTIVLREEWGFKGFIDTDYFAGAYYMNADQMIEAGGDTCLSTFDIGTNFVQDTTSATSLNRMRNAAHDIMYTVVNSMAYEKDNTDVGMERWKVIAIVIDVLLAALIILLEILALRRYKERSNIKIE